MEIFVLVEAALLKAIKYCGSKQRKLAELIGVDPDKVSYWLNLAKKIPFHYAIAIEEITQGLVSKYDLAPYARIKKRTINQDQYSKEFKISDKVSVGIEIEKLLGNRKGSRSDLYKDIDIETAYPNSMETSHRRTSFQVKGKTSEVVAKEAGFTSKDTYLRAKKVVLQGIYKLIEQMDEQQIPIAHAALIAELSPQEQEQLLLEGKEAIKHWIQQQKSKKQSKITVHTESFYQLLHAQAWISAEQHYQIPLRLPFIGLLIHCDGKPFLWDPEQLKNNLLPHCNTDFNTVLETFIAINAIQKIIFANKAYGQFSSNFLSIKEPSNEQNSHC